MKKLRKIHIYIIGVTILGGLVPVLERAINSTPWFLFLTISYVLILRLIAEKYGKE